MTEIHDPHDRFFKELFSRPEVGKDFLTNYLPAKIAGMIDFDTLELTKDSFVDKELGKHFSDLLYKVNLKDGTKAYIYVLVEHKSAPDRLVSFQVLRYMVRIWEQALKEEPSMNRLPPVIPMVVYHGKRKWTVPHDFHSIVRSNNNMNEYIPDFRYLLNDISKYADEEIRGAVVLKVGLLILKHIFREDIAERLPEILGLLRELTNKRTGLEYLETILRYLSAGTDRIKKDDLGNAVRSALTTKGGELMATLAEQWMQEGRIEGKIKGKIEGMLSGIQLALEIKFGGEGLRIFNEINKIEDINRLTEIQEGIRKMNSLDELRKIYQG